MKAMLAHHELAGSVETLEAQQSARVERLADKSLATLVKALFESYVVVEDSDGRDPSPRQRLVERLTLFASVPDRRVDDPVGVLATHLHAHDLCVWRSTSVAIWLLWLPISGPLPQWRGTARSVRRDPLDDRAIRNES